MIQRQRFHVSEEHLTALARVGALGLDYVDLPRWCRARGKQIGWQVPPPILRRDPLICVAQDATSGIYLPQSGAEWTTLLPTYVGPSHLYLCQEPSGNLADSIGSGTLVKNGTVIAYQMAIAGWSAKAVGNTGVAGIAHFTNTSAENISTTSVLTLDYITFALSATETRDLVFHGAGSINSAQGLISSSKIRYRNGAAQADTVNNHAGIGVIPVLIRHDRVNSIARIYTTLEKLSITFLSGAAGANLSLRIGVGTGTAQTQHLYCADWAGTGTESRSDDDYKNMLAALNWQIGSNWSATYSHGVAESVSTSESVAPVVAVAIDLVEAQATATSEALSMTYAANVALAETDSLAETLATQLIAVLGLAEAVATDESMTARLAAALGLAEDYTASEALVAARHRAAEIFDGGVLVEVNAILGALEAHNALGGGLEKN